METSTPSKLLLGHPQHMRGSFTLDISGDPDRVFNLEEPLDYPTGTIDEIAAYHVIEHLNHLKVPIAVASWVRCLKKGGKLIIECPDFDAVIGKYEEAVFDHKDKGKETLWLEWIFGDDTRPGQQHRWGYNIERLLGLFEGLPVDAEAFTPMDYHQNEGPCLRIEATKL